ncbi:hypothetical protein AAVH_17472 [Aphelenchoides avenae]|nr:hypothetical protein AAVH_17472 [Aphelenchus avenae]
MFNGHKVDALHDSGSMVCIVRSSTYKSLCESSNAEQLKHFDLPAYPGQPSDIVVQDASGNAIPFRGRVLCDLRLSESDPEGERFMFLVQDNAPHELVLGTPALFKSTALWSSLERLRDPHVPSFVPECVDLTDPPPQQQSTPSSSAHLHGVRDGGVKKPYRSNNSSRGAPNKPGGGGSRDQWTNNRGQGNYRKGQGNRRH